MDDKWMMKSQNPILVYIENKLFFWIGMIVDKKHNYYSITWMQHRIAGNSTSIQHKPNE